MANIVKNRPIKNAIIISDTHSGDGLSLCPEDFQLDIGFRVKLSPLQKKLLVFWEQFWGEEVPKWTEGEPFCVIHNGDVVDGVHHNSVTQISHNLEDQSKIAEALLKPVVELCEGRYYQIRGTEAHVGKSGQEEERLARSLGAIPDDEGHHARYELWKWLGKDALIHCLHHIGTTGSSAYEATALNKELTETLIEAARWGRRPPDIIVRSHRHKHIEVSIPGNVGTSNYIRAVVTPSWQGKTPFVWKIPGGRLSTPQFGGICIRVGEAGFPYIQHKIWTIDRSKAE